MWDSELHEQATIRKAREGRPRRSISSTKRSRGQKVCSVIQSDVLGSSIDKNMHCERTWQMGAVKYLRESYYHRIKCFATNSLTALMRKWYLNSSFQPYSYPPKTSGRCWCDKDQHQQSNLHVEGRDEGEKIIQNRRETLRERDRKFEKRIL